MHFRPGTFNFEENQMKEIKSASIVGMGALGLMYADIIQRHLGKDAVQFVMDEERLKRNSRTDYRINGKLVKFNLVSEKEVCFSDLVIVAVKFTSLSESLKVIEKLVGPETVIISVLNGITSEEILSERFGKEKIIYSVAQAMDSMRFGSEVRLTKEGELRIGITSDGRKENLDALENFFEKAGIKYTEEKDIIRCMWNKFMLNVGINQTCMAYNATYSEVLNTKELYDVFTGAMKEVMLIANKKQINLSEKEMKAWIELISTFAPDGTPSMGQDRIAKRKSEVELFSGTIIKLGRETGIPVPVNQMLYEKIQQIESEY